MTIVDHGHTFRISGGGAQSHRELTQIRERLVAAENAGDPSAFEALLADDIVIMPPNVAAIEGRAACLDRGTFVHRLRRRNGLEDVEKGGYLWLFACREVWQVARMIGNVTEQSGEGLEELA